MAKKGQAVQLQTEINNHHEWQRFLERDGLLLVDVFSEWCGPCSGMTATLKKIKLEYGGDMLHLAIAKSDYITPLERFRNKSEPTWMFISHGKMVNLLFGCDVPKLTRILLEEIRKENLATSGQKERDFMMEITDLTEEEQIRADEEEEIKRAAIAKEEAKKAKELLERRTLECQNILCALSPMGVVIIFPNARSRYQEVMADLIQEAGIMLTQTEKVFISKEKLDELLYFCEEDELDEVSTEILLNEEALVCLIKPEHGKEIPDITDTILTVVYGPTKQQPGSADTAAQLLFETQVDEETGDTRPLRGIWTPPNHLVRAVSIKLFFTRFVHDFIIPEPEPTPDYLTVIFELLKFNDAIQIMNQYPKQIMQYGFFTNEIPEEAEVVAKTVRKLEKLEQRTYKEKLVMQVSKKRSECILAFAQLGPIYISPNAKEGKRECQIFFPDEYAEEEEEEEEEEEAEEEEPVLATVEVQVKITEEILEELLYFGDTKLTPKTVEDIISNKLSLALLMKRSSETLTGDIDEVILQMVYGNSRKPPGDERSPSQKLMTKEDVELNTTIGVWAPPNSLAKAVALKLLFPNMTAPYKLPDGEPNPFYVAVGYDAFKARDVMDLSAQYPGQVMAYGFFTSDIPAEAQLIAKTVQKFEERTVPTTFDEKIVVQLAKTNPECLLSFSELGPSYMSADGCAGEMDCKIFFPPGYNAPEIEITEVKKKTRRRGKKQAVVVNKELSVATSEVNVDHSEATEAGQVEVEDENENEEQESDEEKPGDSVEVDNDVSLGGTDKATSPRKEDQSQE